MSVKEILKKCIPLRYALHAPKDIVVTIKYKMKIRRLERYPVKTGKDFEIFKGAYKGKRCFVIGLGPSLQVSDLDKLKGEVCFASNSIFQLYDQTEWRPTFFCAGDPRFSEEVGERIFDIVGQAEYAILGLAHIENYNAEVCGKDNVYFYKTIVGTGFDSINKERRRYPEKFNLADELDSVGTITYEMIEMALYMGFSEIYLLGVDNRYNGGSDNYTKGITALSEAHAESMGTLINTTRWTRGYQHIKQVAEKYHVVIKNATRGGCLEVFERVNFDDLTRGQL